MTSQTVCRLTSHLLCYLVCLPISLLLAQTPRDFAVDLLATPSTNTPCLSLSWSLRRPGNISGQAIYRRLKGDCVWAKQADLATNQTAYADATAVPGLEYEYWLERTYSGIYPSTAIGYLSAGVNVPMTEFRGKLLLVVDDTLLAPLAPEIEQLNADLVGEGWAVQTLAAARTNSASAVKALIVAARSADPQNVKAVYLLGHVPVPYSGNIAPDACSDHAGAWPADGYYADADGIWSDSSVNNASAERVQNRNVPGDGKFDQNTFPSFLELMVGRVDMHGMTRAPSQAVSETALLRRYLRKAHDFRMRQGAYATVARRSLIRDDFGYLSGENPAMAGWAWAFTGSGALIDEAPAGQWFSASYAGGKSYLIAYGNGSGSYESASSVGESADFGLRPSRAVFTSLFGQYFGDWDADNSLLRAPLAGNASETSLGLTCFWGGRPNRFMHHLGMGETAGYAMWASNNGSLPGGGSYTPDNSAGVHCGLMGDPTLRLYAVEPARNFSGASSNGLVALAWSPSSETDFLGFHVYRANSVTGTFVRLTASPLSNAQYTDTSVTTGQSYCYMVRTLKRETAPGGTFDNLSVGTPLTVTARAEQEPAPANPARLAVTPYASTNALVTWSDCSSGESGFRIERKENATGSFSPVGTVSANVTNFTDTGVFSSGSVYYYRVIATGPEADSAPSAIVSFDASAGFFDLSQTRLKAYKIAGSVTVTVNRIGGSNGVASVAFATSDSSAFAGVHYVPTNGVLYWADGDTAPKPVTVALVNAAAPQEARQFKISLASPSPGTGLTVNSAAAVLIVDPMAALDPTWSQTVIGSITDSSPAVTVSNAICSVTVGGSGLTSSAVGDAGQFVYQYRSGDGIMTAYLPAGLPSDAGARIALMVRASGASGALMAAAVTCSGLPYGTRLTVRESTGGYPTVAPATPPSLFSPCWLRLTRVGPNFTADCSPDGLTWTQVASASVASMPASAMWGIFHYSSDWSVTALGNYHLARAENVSLTDLPPPSAPAWLRAAADSPTQVTLVWPAVDYASGYRIERCQEYGSFTQLVEVAATSSPTQTWTDATVLADTGYAYRISPLVGSEAGGFSPVAYVTTPAGETVTLLTTGGGNGADATVRIDLPETPQGLAEDLIVAGLDPDSWGMLTNAAKVYLRFDLTGLTTPATARLRLTFTESDNFELWNYYSLSIYALDAGSASWSESGLTWNNAPRNELDDLGFLAPRYSLGDAFDDGLPDAGEELFIDLDPDVLFANRATNNWVTLAMTQYGGASMRWASKEHPSYSAPALELSAPSSVPPRPSFFTAEVESEWAVTLRWQANASSQTSLELQRRTGDGDFALLQNLASNALSFIDATTVPDTTYEYRLRAVKGEEVSTWTVAVSVTTPDQFSPAGTVWDGGGADTLFSTPANWDRNLAPLFDGSLYLNFATAGSVATVNTYAHLLGMSVHRAADFLFADGGGTLDLGARGIRAVPPVDQSRTYTVAAHVVLSADQCWGITNSGSGVTALVVSGPVSDGDASFGFSKSGDGLLTLSGDSDFDGVTRVAAGGGIRVLHDHGLGSAAGGTDVASNGWIEVCGGVNVPEPLILRDAGASGALRSPQGTNVWSGALTLAAPTRLWAAEGSRLSLAGGVSGTADLLLSPDAGGELVVTGSPVSLPGRKIAALGEGTVTFASGGHLYGTLEVSGAGMRLRMAATNALSATGILAIGSGYSSQGLVDLNGFDQTVGRLVRGTTATTSNRVVTSDAPATLTVNETSASAIYFNGHLTGALGLTKGASGYLSLTGTNNTYTGATTVNGGTLEIGSSSRLGFSPSVIINGGTLRLLTTNAISDSALLNIVGSGAKVRLDAAGVEAVGAFILEGHRMPQGTWGASGSGAENTDDSHFEGVGIIRVLTTASEATWDAGAGDTRITTAENWDYDTLPSFDGSSRVIFASNGSMATVDADASFAGVLLNRSGAFTFADGGGTLTLGTGGLSAAGPADTACVYTVSARVALGASQNWGITNSGGGSTALVVSGPISDGPGAFGITKSGDGLLTLSGDNSYDGTTSVAAGGGIRVGHDHGLGSASGGTDVPSNAWVEITGGVNVGEPLTLRDACEAGALRTCAGTNTWSGPVTLAAPTRLRAASGSRLALTGGAAGVFDLLLSPEENAELAVAGGALSLGSRKLAAYGEGTVTIGAGGHAFGSLEVAGVGMRLLMGARNALPASSTLVVGGNYSVQGIVDLCGYDQTVARLIRGNTGTSSNRIVTSSAPATLTVNETSYTPIYYNGHLTGALGLTKAASGYLSLTGTNNTYTGATTVSGGTLEVGASARLGFSPQVTVSNGASLRLLSASALADNAVLSIASGGQVYLQTGIDTVSVLYLGGKRQRRGTYGSSASTATFKNDAFFSPSGTGMINVLHGPECMLLVR